MSDETLLAIRGFILDVRDDVRVEWNDLLPWLERRPQLVRRLHRLGDPDAHRQREGEYGPVGDELYPLGRLVDILISPHQPVCDDPALLAWTTGQPWWPGSLPAAAAWTAFLAAVGAVRIAEQDYHPFFHEIVTVQPAPDPDQRPQLVAEHWPGALVGGLLLARAGVSVCAGANVLDPSIATRSCLYWAWWRRNRVVRDLSHGWGSNSQWGTDFRRDYLIGDQLHYNVDRAGLHAPSPADQDADLSTQDRRDLLRVRHSTVRNLGTDRWPYYDHLIEPRPR